MKLRLRRIALRDTYTIGKLEVLHLGQWQWIADTCEDKVRDINKDGDLNDTGEGKIMHETAIPYGEYEITLDIQSPKYSNFTKYPWSREFDGYLPRLLNVKHFEGILIHCLTPDTEILTEYGWQDMESFKNNKPVKCYSYNTETKKAELVDILGFVERAYNGKLYCCDGKRVCYEVTDKHQMYIGAKKRNGDLDWRFETADNMVKGAHFLTSTIKNGEEISETQKNLYRLVMATQADGYILNWSNKSSQVRFHFTKQRKIDRVIELVNALGCEYKTFIDKENKTHITLDSKLSNQIAEILNPCRLICNYKELPLEFLNLKSEDIKDLVLEYLFWDGRYENYLKNNHNMIITSTNENTINTLQAMCSLCGIRTNKHLEETKGNRSNCWDLVMYKAQEVVFPSPTTYNVKDYNGTVWCLRNRNATLIIRKNGRTMVIGNCGNHAGHSSGCILVGENKVVGNVINSTATFKRIMREWFVPAKERNEKITIEII
jgi:hypothetical protein